MRNVGVVPGFIERSSFALVVLLAVAPALGAKKKPAPKPKPIPAPAPVETTTAEPPKEVAPKKELPKARVELASCPPESLSELEGAALLAFVRKKCEKLETRKSAAPVVVGGDRSLVAICVHGGEEPDALETKSCELDAAVEIAGKAPHPLVPDGDLALVIRTSRLSLGHGEPFALVASSAGDAEKKTSRAPLVFQKSVEGYSHGLFVWLPIPMFTTDFSASPQGYRFGITPLAVAAGLKLHPGSGSGYFGVSAFAAWNLLVPNDTQTLSNGTGVRINYRALGFGVLLDASGFVSLGLGVGHTFTTDARTDVRAWIGFGPRWGEF